MKKVYGYALALVATLTFGGALATSANAADDDSATSTPAVTNSANSDKSVAATPGETVTGTGDNTGNTGAAAGTGDNTRKCLSQMITAIMSLVCSKIRKQ